MNIITTNDNYLFIYLNKINTSKNIICSYDVNFKISSIKIVDTLPGSDHLPLQMTLDVNFNSLVDFIDNSCPRGKVSNLV